MQQFLGFSGSGERSAGAVLGMLGGAGDALQEGGGLTVSVKPQVPGTGARPPDLGVVLEEGRDERSDGVARHQRRRWRQPVCSAEVEGPAASPL